MFEFIRTMTFILAFIWLCFPRFIHFSKLCLTFWLCLLGVIIEVYKDHAETTTRCILPGQSVVYLIVNSVLGVINVFFDNQYAYMVSMSFGGIDLLLTLFYLERKEKEKDSKEIFINN